MRAGQLGQASRGAGDGRIEPDGMRSAGSRSDNSSIIRRLGKIWLFFVSIPADPREGVIADNDPVEQEKAVKYNDLVSNAVIFYNVVEQTRIMKSLMRQGWKITREDVAFLSPYVTSHVKRFGDYLIDVEAVPEPYETELALVV